MEMLADLIPESFFEARSNLLLWAMAVASIALLVFGADRAINAAVRMARALGMSKVIIGATIVSLGTTAPETFVSVTAAFAGKPGLALGNGVGSVICNMAMIFGIGACITRLPKDRFILRRHGWLQFGSGMLLTLVVFVLAAWGGGFAGVVIPRPVGMAFLVLLGVYIWLSVRWARQHPQAVPLEAREDAHRMTAKLILFDVACLLLGLGLVVGGSNLLVGSVSVICMRLGVPPNVLAVTLIAFGTSLPELVTAIASIIKGHPELLVGNIVGANILNVLFVVGASATAVPLGVPAEFFYLHLPVMLVALLLFRIYVMGHDERFRRWQGVPLVVLFGCYYTTMMVLVLTGVLKAKS